MDRSGTGRWARAPRVPRVAATKGVDMSSFRKLVVGAATGVALLVFGLGPGYPQGGPRGTTPSAETTRQLEVLGKVLDIVRSDYVDKPNDEKLLTAAIDGIIKSLDPHSSYMDAKSYRDMQ